MSMFSDVFSKLDGVVRLRHLGIGFVWAWIYCSFSTSAVYSNRAGVSINSDPAWLTSAISVSVLLFAFGALLAKFDLAKIRGVFLLAGIAMSLGTFASALVGSNVEASFACGALTGAGSALLILFWGDLYARIDAEQAEIAVPASSAVMLVCVFVFPYIEGIVGVIGVSSLPLLSAVCLYASYEGIHGSSSSLEVGLRTGSEKRSNSCVKRFSPVIARLLLLVFSAYFVIGLVSALGQERDLFQIVYGFDAASFIGSISGLLLALWFIFFSPRIDVASLFRWLTPFMVVGVAMMAWNSMISEFVTVAMSAVADTVLQVVVLLYFVGLAKRGVMAPSLSVGMSQGAVQLGVLVGNICGLGVAHAGFEMWSVAIVLMCILSVSMAFAPSVNVREVLIPDSNDADAIFDELSDDDEECRRRSTIKRLSSECSLSSRESEILDYLSKGRSQPYIREALVLSKNTVATHVKHIYQKLGVHSRQELLDLFEDKND